MTQYSDQSKCGAGAPAREIWEGHGFSHAATTPMSIQAPPGCDPIRTGNGPPAPQNPAPEVYN
jgi:hypothetical protein